MKQIRSIVYEMPADKYNEKLADALKKVEAFKQPEWSFFVKTGINRQRPPEGNEFWINSSDEGFLLDFKTGNPYEQADVKAKQVKTFIVKDDGTKYAVTISFRVW